MRRIVVIYAVVALIGGAFMFGQASTAAGKPPSAPPASGLCQDLDGNTRYHTGSSYLSDYVQGGYPFPPDGPPFTAYNNYPASVWMEAVMRVPTAGFQHCTQNGADYWGFSYAQVSLSSPGQGTCAGTNQCIVQIGFVETAGAVTCGSDTPCGAYPNLISFAWAYGAPGVSPTLHTMESIPSAWVKQDDVAGDPLPSKGKEYYFRVLNYPCYATCEAGVQLEVKENFGQNRTIKRFVIPWATIGDWISNFNYPMTGDVFTERADRGDGLGTQSDAVTYWGQFWGGQNYDIPGTPTACTFIDPTNFPGKVTCTSAPYTGNFYLVKHWTQFAQ